MILNERVLQVVLTLAQELHFGRAAVRLHVSQPALSGTVRTLEQDLGVRLFRRTSRHVELTDAGHIFAAEARRLLAEGQRVEMLIRNSAPEIAGPLRIGYPASIDIRWLCSLISAARKDARLPSDLQFVSCEAVPLLEEFAKRTLHAAFFAGRLRYPDLQCVTLFRQTFAAVLSASHPLAQVSRLTYDQLHDEPVVWLRREADPLLFDSFTALCAAQGYRPRMAHQAGTFHECLEFTRAGLGITFLPGMAHEPDPTVVSLRLPDGTLYAEYGLAYSHDISSRDVERFVGFVQRRILEDRSLARPLAS